MVAERRLLERLTASDRFMLWEDYGWSGDIGAVAILDGTGLLDRDGRIRIEAVRRRLEPRLHLDPTGTGSFGLRQVAAPQTSFRSLRMGLARPLTVTALVVRRSPTGCGGGSNRCCQSHPTSPLPGASRVGRPHQVLEMNW